MISEVLALMLFSSSGIYNSLYEIFLHFITSLFLVFRVLCWANNYRLLNLSGKKKATCNIILERFP